MPTDGLGTDEELSQEPPKNKEFEAQLMSGCSTIGVVSVITYFMTIWPFAVYPEYSIVGLLKIIGFGILPAQNNQSRNGIMSGHCGAQHIVEGRNCHLNLAIMSLMPGMVST